MSSSKPIAGARVFESARYGHIMVSADVADNGDPCLEFMVAAHPQFLHPTITRLRFKKGFNQHEALENLTGEQVETIAGNTYEQASLFAPIEKESP